MVGLEEFKKALGSSAEQLSEEQILKLRDQQDQMAEIFFGMWINEITDNKKEV